MFFATDSVPGCAWSEGAETDDRGPPDHRELAWTIRGLPDRYRDRVPARTLRQVVGAASAGEWEKAVDRLIVSLYERAEPVTLREREELRAILKATNMAGDHVDYLRGTEESPVTAQPLAL